MTMKPVETVKRLKDREVQRALMQFFKPENYFVVRKALIEADRKELIGEGPLSLIPSNPPKEALLARRGAANSKRGDRSQERTGAPCPASKATPKPPASS
jgi:hypothetical protein